MLWSDFFHDVQAGSDPFFSLIPLTFSASFDVYQKLPSITIISVHSVTFHFAL